MKGVTFGTYHSYDDFSLILTSKEIAAPKTKTVKIDVEGADGSIETALHGLTLQTTHGCRLTFHS